MMKEPEYATLYPKAMAAGIPSGPYAEHEVLTEEMQKLAISVDKLNGGFSVHRARVQAGSERLGPKLTLQCTAKCEKEDGDGAKKSCKCPWRAVYEKTYEGWCLVCADVDHLHPLSSSKPEVMATAAGRQIPSAYAELCELLAQPVALLARILCVS
jgi:hypothetical protein